MRIGKLNVYAFKVDELTAAFVYKTLVLSVNLTSTDVHCLIVTFIG